jgi:AAA+ ATPase superfamily predicted ATPase
MAEAEFIGRHGELQLLDSLWQSSRATLLILYGRRRVGKTRLLTHWLKRRPDPDRALYWVAEPSSALDQLRSFSQAIYNFTTPDAPAPLDFTYANWEQAFRQVALISQEKRMALFIDEVTYLIDVDPTIVGTLQKAWDHWMSKSNLFIALSGSQMGLMQSRMLSYQAPLYGRATAQVELSPLPFGITRQFFPTFSASDRVAIYSIWGGIPAYWERIDGASPIMDSVRVQLLPVNAFMREEPHILLQDFISDPHNYVGIMRAITQGAQTNNGIATHTGLAKGHISKYLSVLRKTGFVKRRVPVTEDAAKSRRGRYFVTDPYLRFYYRFLAAYQAKLALGGQQEMLHSIEQNLPQFIQSNTWQELCREWLLRASTHGQLPLSIEDVGSAWTRSHTFGVVGIDKAAKNLVLGCCQWDEEASDSDPMLSLLKRTSSLVPKDGQWSVHYIGFSPQGWTPDVEADVEKAVARSRRSQKNWHVTGVQLLDLDQVDTDLARWSFLAN